MTTPRKPITPPPLRRRAPAVKAAARDTRTGCLLLIIGLILVLPTAALYGFTVKTLWAWFVTPLHVVPIALWQGAGLYLLIRLFTVDYTIPRESEKSAGEKFLYDVLTPIIGCGFTLLFALIYHSFM